MNFSAFVIRIAFLALPGLLGSKLYRKLRGRTQKKNWEDFLEILLFSLASYMVLALAVAAYSGAFGAQGERAPAKEASTQQTTQPAAKTSKGEWTIPPIDAIWRSGKPLAWDRILTASIIGLSLGIVAAYVHNFSLVNRAAIRLKATKRSGDEDVWHELFNSANVQWVFVRDHKLSLVYYGYVRRFSDSEKQRELLLENVDVYTNDQAEPLYSAPALYLSRNSDELTVELPREIGDNESDEVERETKDEQEEG